MYTLCDRLERIKESVYQRFPDEKACQDFLEKMIWKGLPPWCPKCGEPDAYHLNDGWLKCRNPACYHTFSTKTNSPFKGMILPLREVFVLVEICLAEKEPISRYKVARVMDICVRTAYRLMKVIQDHIDYLDSP